MGSFPVAAWRLDALALALATVALRVPAFLSSKPLVFDDGQYGAAAVAMRAGALPFREVFSSQGPLFLPLVYVFDLLGGRTLDAPRLLALAAAVLLTLAVYAAGRELTDRPGAVVAAALVACSGSVWWTTGPLTSDGPGAALACAAFAVALGYARAPTRRRAVVIGVLAAAAFAIKSLLVVPVLVAVVLLVVTRRRTGDVVAAAVAAAALIVIVTVPWGVHNVIEQSVTYHTDAAGRRHVAANLRKTFDTLLDRDAPVLVTSVLAVAIAAGGAALARRRSRRAGRVFVGIGAASSRPGAGTARAAPVWPVAVWTVLAIAVLAIETPMWRNHLVHLVPALALLAVVYRPPWALLAVAALALVPYHVLHVHDLWNPPRYKGSEAAVEHQLKSLPRGALAISDDPGLVWRAGHATPPNFVDASVLRIDSTRPGLRLTSAVVAHGAADRSVCAVVVWSNRFGRFSDLPARLQRVGYERAASYPGGRSVWTRPCRGAR
ncbi:MAG: glycosyltransferase family 39 protein [Actinobacteria bacterium]|nr:glycosyltransferase family 39 protein [Actinomycetota bacterium]